MRLWVKLKDTVNERKFVLLSQFRNAHLPFVLFFLSSALALSCSSSFADDGNPDAASSDSANAANAEDNSYSTDDSKSPDNKKGSAGTDKNERRFSKDLSQFEMRFFEKKYQDENDSQRLDRIERLVYGKRQQGDSLSRIERLLQDVPHLGDGLPKSDPAVAAVDKSAADKTQEAAKKKTDESPSTSTNGSQTTAVSPQSDTTIPVAEEPPVTTFSNPYQSRSLVSEVANLEQQVYGKQYAGDTLIDRVRRLEKTIYPGQTPQSFMPITTRINRLMMALQPKFSAPTSVYTTPSSNETVNSGYPATAPNYYSTCQLPAKTNYYPDQSYSANSNYDYSGGKNPYGNSTYDAGQFSNATATNTSKEEQKPKTKGHPFLHKLGHFLGEVGEAAAVTAGSIAAGSMMGYGYGGYGYGYPGFGYGYGMPYGGFGGRPFMGYW